MLTREMVEYIGSREILMEWVALSLWERVKLFNRKFGTHICAQTLGGWYKRLNIRHLRP